MPYNQSYIEGKERIARLLRGKKSPQGDNRRIPRGQVETKKFPVLDLGVKPDFDPKTWRLRVYGLVEKEQLFSYRDVLQMPSTLMTADFHCVTHWTKLDVKWKGVKHGKRRIPCAEIVKSDSESPVLQALQDLYDGLWIIDERRFCDFQMNPRSIDARLT